MGLAAQYILHDDVELSLPIPHGPYDVPLILKDAMFQQNGDLIIDDNGEDSLYGDVILVNGRPWPLMQVEPRKYRFRVLNASVSRSYDLALDTGEPLTVIGCDGGLMPHPQPVGNFRIGMAERYEVVIDFAKYAPGTRVVLRNLQPDNNEDFDNTDVVMAFQVGNTVSSSANNHVPQDLNPNMAVMGLQESDSVATRHFRFKRENGHWTINGTTWEDVVNSDYEFVLANPGFEDTEIWELENTSGGWFHPVHIHLVDFKILDRNGEPPLPHERGPKDVVYVGENETVRVIMKFENQQGKYMMHCHNLVHEDHDMMGQFSVGDVAGDKDRNHPIKGDPCKNQPAGALFTRPRPRDDDNSGPGNADDRGRGSDAVAAPSERPPAIRASSIRRASTKKKRKKLIKCKPPKRRTLVTKNVKVKRNGKTRTVKRKVTTCRVPKKRASAVRRPKKRT
jgi:FtsP/CotA-like multicopper oxidase with cupredoxin domain